jgi:hypothetical protein
VPQKGKDGKIHDLTDDKYINRLYAFVSQNAESETFGDVIKARIKYICEPIEAINAQASKGVHANVSRREADSTVLQTYFLLADLVEIAKIPDKLLPNNPQSAELDGKTSVAEVLEESMKTTNKQGKKRAEQKKRRKA